MVAQINNLLKKTANGHALPRGGNMLSDDIDKFDDIFSDGIYAFPPDPKAPKVKIRALDEYCRKKGVEPKELSKEEMKKFLVYTEC